MIWGVCQAQHFQQTYKPAYIHTYTHTFIHVFMNVNTARHEQSVSPKVFLWFALCICSIGRTVRKVFARTLRRWRNSLTNLITQGATASHAELSWDRRDQLRSTRSAEIDSFDKLLRFVEIRSDINRDLVWTTYHSRACTAIKYSYLPITYPFFSDMLESNVVQQMLCQEGS